MEFFRKAVSITFFEDNPFDSTKFVILISLLFNEVLKTLTYFWEITLFHQYVWIAFQLKAFRNNGSWEGTSRIWLLQKIQS